MFFLLLLLIWTLGGSVQCSNVGLHLHLHPSPDEGSGTLVYFQSPGGKLPEFSSGSPSYPASLGSRIIGSKTFGLNSLGPNEKQKEREREQRRQDQREPSSDDGWRYRRRLTLEHRTEPPKVQMRSRRTKKMTKDCEGYYHPLIQGVGSNESLPRPDGP